MRHSVRARHDEVQNWASLSIREMTVLLNAEHSAFSNRLANVNLLPQMTSQVTRQVAHLRTWSDALNGLE